MDILNEFRDAVADPIEYITKFKEASDKPIIGFVCSYTPEEIIIAAGAHPVRLFSQVQDIALADAHIQAYCCSPIRGILEQGLKGAYDVLDGMVFPHTCDSIQRFSDIWRLNIVTPFFADVVVPVKLTTDSSRMYMYEVVKRFKSELESGFQITITEDQLLEAIQVTNTIRSHIRAIYELRSQHPGIISGKDVATIVKAAMIMDRSWLVQHLGDVVEVLKQRMDQVPMPSEKRIVISGSICDIPDIYDIAESAGLITVWDDLCTGSRYVEPLVASEGDALERIARRYLVKGTCPAKHQGLTVRGERLMEMIRKHRAGGVLFVLMKFCDPHGFDYPYIKQLLDAEKIAHLLLEIEDRLPPEGQLRTRLETFAELIQ